MRSKNRQEAIKIERQVRNECIEIGDGWVVQEAEPRRYKPREEGNLWRSVGQQKKKVERLKPNTYRRLGGIHLGVTHQ